MLVALAFAAINVAKYGDIGVMKALFSTDVKAWSNCQAIDGNKNNGHCVHDNANHYFCKSPGLLQSTNCKMVDAATGSSTINTTLNKGTAGGD